MLATHVIGGGEDDDTGPGRDADEQRSGFGPTVTVSADTVGRPPTIRRRRLPNELMHEMAGWVPMSYFRRPTSMQYRHGPLGQFLGGTHAKYKLRIKMTANVVDEKWDALWDDRQQTGNFTIYCRPEPDEEGGELKEQTIRAHKFVLYRCPYFAELIDCDPLITEMRLDDISWQIMDRVLRYMYAGKEGVLLERKDFPGVIEVATRFKLDGLVEKAQEAQKELCKCGGAEPGSEDADESNGSSSSEMCTHSAGRASVEDPEVNVQHETEAL